MRMVSTVVSSLPVLDYVSYFLLNILYLLFCMVTSHVLAPQALKGLDARSFLWTCLDGDKILP